MENKRACVASGHVEVTKAAHAILEEGGNAFDAAVAAGFASSVAEPALTSLGGGGFLLARTAEGQTILFDFFVNTPGLGRKGGLEPHFFPVTVHFPGCAQDFNVGMGSVAVPGNIKGFLHVHHRLGRLPLRKVLEPAIKLAREGVTLNEKQAYFLSLLNPIMTLFKEGRELFEPNGNYLGRGDCFKNPHLAAFLEELAKVGDALFYSELASQIEQDMDQGQGLLTKRDLETYRVIERPPIVTEYRGHHFISNPPPSFGGWLIVLGLNCLSGVDLSALTFGDAQHLKVMAHFLREWEQLRGRCPEDPHCPEVRHTRTHLKRLFSRGTTHLSIVDQEGNAASMTTSNGEGSGYIVRGTGIMLNNMMGEDDLHPEGFHASPPGIRVSSMMAPSLITKGNELRFVVGSGGSKRIRSAILEVTTYCLDFNMGIQEAVIAPRLHYEDDILQIEPGFPQEALSGLKGEFNVNIWDTIDVYFGGVHAVDAKNLEAAADERRGGYAQCSQIQCPKHS